MRYTVGGAASLRGDDGVPVQRYLAMGRRWGYGGVVKEGDGREAARIPEESETRRDWEGAFTDRHHSSTRAECSVQKTPVHPWAGGGMLPDRLGGVSESGG